MKFCFTYKHLIALNLYLVMCTLYNLY